LRGKAWIFWQQKSERMKIAVLADIHGNSIALDAVIQDIEQSGGVDEFWILGDLVAIGPDPAGVLERLEALPKALSVRGNTDRFVVSGELPWPRLPDVEKDPALFQLHFRIARSFAWTAGAVAASGRLAMLRQLPLEMRLQLPDGTRVLAVHAQPGADDGTGIHPKLSDQALVEFLSGAEADLIFVGHTHTPFDRTVGDLRVVNPGSVSNPFPPDLTAAYALLEAREAGYEIAFQRVEYDREAVIEAAREVDHPSAEYIIGFMKGENRPDWIKSV
jgi:putative phosphoesterase